MNTRRWCCPSKAAACSAASWSTPASHGRARRFRYGPKCRACWARPWAALRSAAAVCWGFWRALRLIDARTESASVRIFCPLQLDDFHHLNGIKRAAYGTQRATCAAWFIVQGGPLGAEAGRRLSLQRQHMRRAYAYAPAATRAALRINVWKCLAGSGHGFQRLREGLFLRMCLLQALSF